MRQLVTILLAIPVLASACDRLSELPPGADPPAHDAGVSLEQRLGGDQRAAEEAERIRRTSLRPSWLWHRTAAQVQARIGVPFRDRVLGAERYLEWRGGACLLQVNFAREDGQWLAHGVVATSGVTVVDPEVCLESILAQS